LFSFMISRSANKWRRIALTMISTTTQGVLGHLLYIFRSDFPLFSITIQHFEQNYHQECCLSISLVWENIFPRKLGPSGGYPVVKCPQEPYVSGLTSVHHFYFWWSGNQRRCWIDYRPKSIPQKQTQHRNTLILLMLYTDWTIRSLSK